MRPPEDDFQRFADTFQKNLIREHIIACNDIATESVKNGPITQQQMDSFGAKISVLTTTLQNKSVAIQTYTMPRVTKKAVLVGINYTGTTNELRGAPINDIIAIRNKLKLEYGFTDIRVLTDVSTIKPTRINILREFTSLLTNAVVGDTLVFMYSGHGSYITDTNSDEKDKYDERIYVLDNGHVMDDDFRSIISKHLKQGVLLVGIFDSCFSGSMLDLKYTYTATGQRTIAENIVMETLGDVLLISGSRDMETSASAKINGVYHGAMTWALLSCMSKQISWSGMIFNIQQQLRRAGFTQNVRLSSGKIFDPTRSVISVLGNYI